MKDKIPFFLKKNISFLQISINTAKPRTNSMTSNVIVNTMPVDDPSFACFSLKKEAN